LAGGGTQTVTYRCPDCSHTWQDVRTEKRLTPLGVEF
jgi:transposase-like protein